MAIELLVFEVEGRKYSVPALDVVEVVRAATLSPLPQQSEMVEGLLNLRGRVLPVIDLRRVFQLREREIEHTDHLVVVQENGRNAALRVDRALELILIPSQDQPAPKLPDPGENLLAAIERLGDGIVHVLDTSRLLSADDVILSLTGRSVAETSR